MAETVSRETLNRLYSNFVPQYDPAAAARESSGDEGVPLLTPEIVEEIRSQLDSEPDLTLDVARRILDASITVADLHQFLDQMDGVFRNPELAIESTPLTESSVPLPKDFDFDGMRDSNGTAKYQMASSLGNHKFEGWNDWKGYGFNTVAAVLKRVFLQSKAEFQWAENHASAFRYPIDSRTSRIALFSDFGTGLYHSRFIADFMVAAKPSHAIHLGDIYYCGRANEVNEYFRKPLAALAETSALWTIAGNHDYYGGGKPFFQTMRDRRKGQPQVHKQEGSYFCLDTERFRIVAADVQYHEPGRLKESRLRKWLRDSVSEAKQRDKSVILLTTSEPHSIDSPNTTALWRDIRECVSLDDIDLWFWGNTHYCAFFGPSDRMPCYSSCIGHGGYPYEVLTPHARQTDVARYMWAEVEPRFPKWTKVRPDMGNNGFVLMDIDDNARTLKLEYRDWTNDVRMTALMSAENRKLVHKMVIPNVRDLRKR